MLNLVPNASSDTFPLAAIRHELGPIHEYDFVEGTISSPLAPGRFIIFALLLLLPSA